MARMRSDPNNLLAKPRPSIAEFILMMFIAGVILWLFTWSDTILHDNYVRRVLAECYVSNHSKFCETARVELECKQTENQQMCIGNKYAQVIVTQVYVVGFTMFVIRIALAYLVGRKITATVVLTGLLWGFTTVGLFSFGFEDWAYYTTRDMEIPDKLEWLNGAGLFNYTRQFGNDPVNVDRSDLYLTMFLGGLAITSFWAMMMWADRKHYRKLKNSL